MRAWIAAGVAGLGLIQVPEEESLIRDELEHLNDTNRTNVLQRYCGWESRAARRGASRSGTALHHRRATLLRDCTALTVVPEQPGITPLMSAARLGVVDTCELTELIMSDEPAE
jgi:hypothetical protein